MHRISASNQSKRGLKSTFAKQGMNTASLAACVWNEALIHGCVAHIHEPKAPEVPRIAVAIPFSKRIVL